MTPTHSPTDARTAVKELSEGDVIRVPQYTNALEVTHCGELNGEPNAFIGVQFHDDAKRTSAEKHMVVNRHSGRVYLQAGTTDKGEVREIELVAPAGHDDDVECAACGADLENHHPDDPPLCAGCDWDDLEDDSDDEADTAPGAPADDLDGVESVEGPDEIAEKMLARCETADDFAALDVPGHDSATGVDDPVPDAEYGDDRDAARQAALDAVGDQLPTDTVGDIRDVRHVHDDRQLHLVAHPDADAALCGSGAGGLRAAGNELEDLADAAQLGAFVNCRDDMCAECRDAFNDAIFPGGA